MFCFLIVYPVDFIPFILRSRAIHLLRLVSHFHLYHPFIHFLYHLSTVSIKLFHLTDSASRSPFVHGCTTGCEHASVSNYKTTMLVRYFRVVIECKSLLKNVLSGRFSSKPSHMQHFCHKRETQFPTAARHVMRLLEFSSCILVTLV